MSISRRNFVATALGGLVLGPSLLRAQEARYIVKIPAFRPVVTSPYTVTLCLWARGYSKVFFKQTLVPLVYTYFSETNTVDISKGFVMKASTKLPSAGNREEFKEVEVRPGVPVSLKLTDPTKNGLVVFECSVSNNRDGNTGLWFINITQ